MSIRTGILAASALAAAVTAAGAVLASAAQSRPTPGILGRPAPSWGVERWINLPDGAKSLDVGDFEGKVLYLYCFQSWCPGCHAHGFPTLRTMIERYRDSDDVAFVAVQTVFEGFQTNTAAAARRTADRYDLAIPVGHDGERGRRSTVMQRYRTGGTPWTVIIDKTGTVRYNDFHTTAADASRLIDRLRDEDRGGKDSSAGPPEARPVPTVPTLPDARGGQDLVGTALPPLHFDRWLTAGEHPARAPKKGQVTLYRWWTNTCPYCEASLPAIDKLRSRYADEGLAVVAVYHPKPPRAVPAKTITSLARRFGYHGTIAVDEDWSELERLYLAGKTRGATSASFLVDASGTIRFVHPGPVLFPSDDPASARENADFHLLDEAIKAVLAESRSDRR